MQLLAQADAADADADGGAASADRNPMAVMAAIARDEGGAAALFQVARVGTAGTRRCSWLRALVPLVRGAVPDGACRYRWYAALFLVARVGTAGTRRCSWERALVPLVRGAVPGSARFTSTRSIYRLVGLDALHRGRC